MDKYDVRLMPRAMRDLDGIYAYIAKTLLEPGTALDMVDEIEREIFSLDYMPYRCPERRCGVYANRGYRQLYGRDRAGAAGGVSYETWAPHWGDACVHPSADHPGEMLLECPGLGLRRYSLGRGQTSRGPVILVEAHRLAAGSDANYA